MKTIWKFRFEIVSPLRISMPQGAQVLTVQDQDGVACLWAMVESENELEPRYFEILGTGQRISNTERRYVGTFQQPPFVWHVFEIVREHHEQ